MAPERNEQQTIFGAIQDAEVAARFYDKIFAARRRHLLHVAKECGDDVLCRLLDLVYAKTRRGVGRPWKLENVWPSVAAGPLGLCCGRSKAHKTIAIARGCRLLLDLGNGLAINWPEVFRRRGMPLPPQLAAVRHADEQSATRTSRPPRGRAVRHTDEQSATRTEKSATRTSGDETHSISAHTRAGAPCLVCLDVLSSSTDNTNIAGTPFWGDVVIRTKKLADSIFSHRPNQKRGTETLEFLHAVSIISLAVHSDAEDWRGWLDIAEEVTRRKRADNPSGFLRRTLERQLIYHLGLCETPDEAVALFAKCLVKAKLVVQAARRQIRSQKQKEEAVA